jgi:hypothetical protein
MCLVNAKLYYEQDYRGATLKGAVTNKQTDKTACTPGTLSFSNAAELRPLFEAKEKYDTVITMKKKLPTEKTGIKVIGLDRHGDRIAIDKSGDFIILDCNDDIKPIEKTENVIEGGYENEPRNESADLPIE